MTFWDKNITAVLLTFAILQMICQGLFLTDTEGERVVIQVDNKEYATYNFSDIKGEKMIDIKTEFGENTVLIRENSVCVTDASCPDKLDVKAGEISKTNQVIVCLPNKLMIEIKGGERKVDKVTY